MSKENVQITDLKDLMNKHNLFDKFNLNRLGIFGSVARGEESNDIDILIEENIDYRQLAAFRDELEKLVQKRIDIVIEKYANPIVLYRAKKELVYVTKH